MRANLIILLAAASIFGFADSASALTFTLDSVALMTNDPTPGLALCRTDSTRGTVDLEVGESTSFRHFEIGTAGMRVNADDIFWKEVCTGFEFSDPSISSDFAGATRGRWVFQDGVARWAGPGEFSFGDGGLIAVTLSDVPFQVPGKADVSGTVRYGKAPLTGTAPVPEPATLLLLGSGLVGITAIMVFRRRKLFRRRN